MKFYEVQKALEEGKKIRRTSWNQGSHLFFGTKEQSGRNILIYHILTKNSASSGAYKLDTDAIFADDWEIIDDIPEVEVKTIIEEYVICPGCKTKLEIIESHKNLRICGYCGKNIKLKRKEEHPRSSDLRGVYVNTSWKKAYLEK